MTWRPEDDEELRDWEVEPEEEREDRNPTLSGTAPVARFIFIGLLLLVVLGGVLAFINALGRWMRN